MSKKKKTLLIILYFIYYYVDCFINTIDYLLCTSIKINVLKLPPVRNNRKQVPRDDDEKQIIINTKKKEVPVP